MWSALSDERTDLSFQLLLGLASAINLWSEFSGTHDHILLSQIKDSRNLEGQVPVFIQPRNTVAQLYLFRQWVLFPLPPTTCRATVEVLEHASTKNDGKYLFYVIH
jgi:hypothetical protein